MPPTTPRCTQLDAAPHWRVVDFISDLHLQASEVATFDAWVRYLHNTPADAVFMLGDLFEVWVGDDAADEPGAFEARCAEVLRSAAQRRVTRVVPSLFRSSCLPIRQQKKWSNGCLPVALPRCRQSVK